MKTNEAKLSTTVDNLRVSLKRANRPARPRVGAELQTNRGITQQKSTSVGRAHLLPG